MGEVHQRAHETSPSLVGKGTEIAHPLNRKDFHLHAGFVQFAVALSYRVCVRALLNPTLNTLQPQIFL